MTIVAVALVGEEMSISVTTASPHDPRWYINAHRVRTTSTNNVYQPVRYGTNAARAPARPREERYLFGEPLERVRKHLTSCWRL